MTPEEIRIKELQDALGWIVFHLEYRPSLARKFNLVTECERNSLARVLNSPATEIVKSRGEDVLATGFEVALIGRLPQDQVSSEVESYLYAMRAEVEAQAKRIKELEATDAGKLPAALQLLRDANHELDIFTSGDREDDDLYYTIRDWLEAYDSCEPGTTNDGETPFGIELDGGSGDDQ